MLTQKFHNYWFCWNWCVVIFFSNDSPLTVGEVPPMRRLQFANTAGATSDLISSNMTFSLNSRRMKALGKSFLSSKRVLSISRSKSKQEAKNTAPSECTRRSPIIRPAIPDVKWANARREGNCKRWMIWTSSPRTCAWAKEKSAEQYFFPWLFLDLFVSRQKGQKNGQPLSILHAPRRWQTISHSPASPVQRVLSHAAFVLRYRFRLPVQTLRRL